MSDDERDENLQELIEIRKVHVNYEEHQHEAGAFDIPVDLHNFKKFPVADPPVTHKKVGHDVRAEIKTEDSKEFPDYGGPFKADLRFSDFSNKALVNMLAMSAEYFSLCIRGWAEEVAQRYGQDVMSEIQSEAWQNTVLPQLRRMIDEWMELPDNGADAVVADVEREVAARRENGGVVTISPFKVDPKYLEYPKERLVKLALGSHEYLLTVIEA